MHMPIINVKPFKHFKSRPRVRTTDRRIINPIQLLMKGPCNKRAFLLLCYRDLIFMRHDGKLSMFWEGPHHVPWFHPLVLFSCAKDGWRKEPREPEHMSGDTRDTEVSQTPWNRNTVIDTKKKKYTSFIAQTFHKDYF